ncbi:MAG: hypothetical protein JWR26_2011 [Pedosphaera sp.]|nr:hypothetical protein [Pedosphaera sp.]
MNHIGAKDSRDLKDVRDLRDERVRLGQGQRVAWGAPARRRSEAMAWRFARLEGERLAKRRHHQAALASVRLSALGFAWIRLGPLGAGYFEGIFLSLRTATMQRGGLTTWGQWKRGFNHGQRVERREKAGFLVQRASAIGTLRHSKARKGTMRHVNRNFSFSSEVLAHGYCGDVRRIGRIRILAAPCGAGFCKGGVERLETGLLVGVVGGGLGRPVGVGGAGGFQISLELGDDVGVFVGDVGCFSGVGLEVVEFEGAIEAGAEGFPFAIADGLLEAVVAGFPVERFVTVTLALAAQGGGEGDAVEAFGRGCLGEFSGGGEDVPEGGGDISGGAGFEAAEGPTDDEGDADATFVEFALGTAEGAGALEIFGVDAALFSGAVNAGEDDDGVVVHLHVFEFLHELAYVAIEAGDHGGAVFLGLRPGFVGVGGVVGDFHAVTGAVGEVVVGAGNGVGQVKEEGAIVIEALGLGGVEEVQGGFGEVVVGVFVAFAFEVVFDLDVAFVAFAGAVEELGEVFIGLGFFEETEPLVETFLGRDAGGAGSAEAPDAECAGVIAGLFEEFGEGEVVGFERDGAFATDAGVAGVFAGQERGARGSGCGTASVEAGEAQAFRGECVDVGRPDLGLAVAAEVAVAEVIGEDEEDGGFARRGLGLEIDGVGLGSGGAGQKGDGKDAKEQNEARAWRESGKPISKHGMEFNLEEPCGVNELIGMPARRSQLVGQVTLEKLQSSMKS